MNIHHANCRMVISGAGHRSHRNHRGHSFRPTYIACSKTMTSMTSMTSMTLSLNFGRNYLQELSLTTAYFS